MAEDLKTISPLEHLVLDVVWSLGSGTADQVRRELGRVKRVKDSTVRTVLRRLEDKGYVEHEVDGRTFVYRPAVGQQNAAVSAVRQIIARFCGGSARKLLVGMVADEMITSEELRRLAEQVARAGRKRRG